MGSVEQLGHGRGGAQRRAQVDSRFLQLCKARRVLAGGQQAMGSCQSLHPFNKNAEQVTKRVKHHNAQALGLCTVPVLPWNSLYPHH